MAKVSVAYVPKGESAVCMELDYEPGATVADILQQSGMWQSHPETKNLVVGIYAKRVSLTTLVKPGDRIELYRPLLIDPKENRRHRARQLLRR